MTMTTIYDTMLSLIDDKFRRQAILENQRRALAHFADRVKEGVRSESAVSLEPEIDQNQAELDRLELAISKAADEILGFPLWLVPLSPSDRPFVYHLEMARAKAADGAVDEALWECDHALRLLKSDPDRQSCDRGLVWLFQSGISCQSGDCETVQTWSERAHRCFIETDDLYRAVVRLIQLRSHAVTEAPGVLGSQTAYREAVRRLQVLYETEARGGDRCRAELYRVLKGNLEQRAEDIQDLDYPLRKGTMLYEVPPPFERIRVIGDDDLPMGEEKPVSDNGTEYIDVRRVGEFDFEFLFEGQPLKLKPLKGSRVSFLSGYDHIAVRVSGDSMDLADIHPGDYVILRVAQTVPPYPNSGDIVAVVFRDEADNKATLKRIHIDRNKAILRPESSNPAHQPRRLELKNLTEDDPTIAVAGIAIVALKRPSVSRR
jgi:phage repressor protein C with HTH and peptisase S24 domain